MADDLDPNDIEIRSGLNAAPSTDTARVALETGWFDDPWLREAESRLRTAQGREKRSAIESAEHALEQGQILDDVVQRYDHKFMETWVEKTRLYKSRMANYYRCLYLSGMSAATIAAMGIRAAAESIHPQIDPQEREMQEAIQAAQSGTPRKGRKSLYQRLEHIRDRATRARRILPTPEPQISEAPAWQTPTEVGDVLYVSWRGLIGSNPNAPTQQIAYVWRIAEDKFKWVFLQYDGLQGRTNGYKGYPEVSGPKGETWGRVQIRLAHWNTLASSIVDQLPLARDLLHMKTIEHLWIALKMERVSRKDLLQYSQRDIGRLRVRQDEV
jgi:hypothetical protein